jgi:hypothetical protein
MDTARSLDINIEKVVHAIAGKLESGVNVIVG